MDNKTYERLQTLIKTRDKNQANVTLCDNQIFAIYDICDHKWPDGTSARGRYKCQICGR